MFCKKHALSRDSGKLEGALMWHSGSLRQVACAAGIKHKVDEGSFGRAGASDLLVRPPGIIYFVIYSLFSGQLLF